MKRSFFVSLLSTTFSNLIPLAIFVIIFTHIDNPLQVCGNLIILASFDADKTIKAIVISCLKAFAYSVCQKNVVLLEKEEICF